MLGWIGCLLMVAAGSGLGFYYSAQFARREFLLKELYRMINALKGEISYGNQPLQEAFLRMGKRLRPPVSSFCKEVGEAAGGHLGVPFGEIFEESLGKSFGGAGLERQDLEALSELGSQLGYLDRQTQLRVLDLYGHTLLDTLEPLTKELPGKKKVCKSLGILGGVFLAVLLA